MATGGRAWRLDDWFRPVRRDGTMPSGQRAVTPRDRLWMLAFLVVGAVIVLVLFLRFDAGRAFAMSGGFIGVAAVQLVNLYRSRATGFGLGP